MIISRTPLRVSFVGGGSDLPAFYSHTPGAVVSTAINKYMTEHKTNGISFDEKSFYLGQVDFAPLLAVMAKNPQFLKDNGFQSPLSARVGVRFLF